MAQHAPSTTPRRSVLVLTDDVLSSSMAGPAIRAWNIAEVLADHHDVRLASTVRSEASSPRFAVCDGTPERLRGIAEGQDVVVVQGFTLAKNPWLADLGARVVVDLYDPIHLEILEMARQETARRRTEMLQASVRALQVQARAGDFFLAASERQRDFWLGHLAAWGRVNDATYRQDPTLRALIDVAPFGIPREPATTASPAIKGRIDGIGPDDVVLLWGGGVYNWFDPVTLVRALGELRDSAPAVRLVFMGTTHPSMADPETAALREAVRAATDLGLVGTHVFFTEGWVPYAQRAGFLTDADLGVSTHFDHVETSFSFRTRMLDYLWAGLPIVCTSGDTFADLVAEHDLGRVVPPRDPAALARAITELLDPDVRAGCTDRIAAVRERFRWDVALRPLVDYVAEAPRAADLAVRTSAVGRAAALGARVDDLAGEVRRYVEANGWQRLARRAGQLVWQRTRSLTHL
ncbi:glycosyltransferase [uncultured Cellulomonas sp.]|uniref:glycosyltransferase n=1 Tax=uncultured Cellulomonas sp. TaxID=189682 RepID=UPI00262F59D3|nr:glycosyltransferase [uncultured Cellulomonas sp.]